MLKSRLINPALLRALAGAGHGSRILLADGNYPATTAAGRHSVLVELAIAADLPTVAQILALVHPIVPLESAAVMTPVDPDQEIPVHGEYQRVLERLPLERLDRHKFYEAAKGDDLAVVVTTGDRTHYANLLLTVGTA